MVNNCKIPRRNNLAEMTAVELIIFECMGKVEDLGCSTHLTSAVIFLQSARDKVADFVDGVPEE